MYKMNLFVFLLYLSVYPQKYDLKWAEEFDGPEINTEIWNFEKGFAKNYEQQFILLKIKMPELRMEC